MFDVKISAPAFQCLLACADCLQYHILLLYEYEVVCLNLQSIWDLAKSGPRRTETSKCRGGPLKLYMRFDCSTGYADLY